ncbi:MAG: hypothetical protein Kow0029_32100 [Candidatus Rifleibacteriota bacterium]
MKRFFALFCLLFIYNFAFAEIPVYQDCLFRVNLRAEKVIDGFYGRIESFQELKPVLQDFDEIFKDNSGINPRTDIKNLGLIGLLGKKSRMLLVGYIDGNFNPSRIIAEIEAAAGFIPPAANKKIGIEQSGNHQIIVISDERRGKSLGAYFASNNLIIVCDKKNLSDLIEGKIKFSKTETNKNPDFDAELSIWIDTKSIKDKLSQYSNPAFIPVLGILGMFRNFQIHIDKNDLKVLFNCEDDATAENLKTFLEGQLAGYKIFIDSQLKSAKKPDKGANWLPKAFYYLMQRSLAVISKKSLEMTAITRNDSLVTLKTSMPPVLDSLLSPTTIGATGILAAIAIPNFQKARAKALKKTCEANQRALMTAIKKYNSNNSDMLKSIDDAVIKMLIKEKYLKNMPECPAGGEYSSEGSLCGPDGKIKCSKHGSAK